MRRSLAAIVLCLIACAAFAQAPQPARVLFIGNALTTAGDFPARLAKAAAATGREVATEVVSGSRYALEDHASDGRTMETLRRGWDFVVLQQDAPAASQRARFTGDVKRLADAIRAAGGKPVLFMTWPRGDRPAAFRDSIALHREAAQASGVILVPAAEAWLRALGQDRNVKLYAGEGTQAAPLGNDLAVLTLYFALFPAGPQEFDEAFVGKIARALDLPPSSRDLLVDAATRAIDEPLALGNKRSP